MAIVAEELATIDNGLRFVFFGLEVAMGIYFSGVECERVFTDSEEDQVSAKRYLFHTSPSVVVTGRVDDYEPETIWLRIEGLRNADKILQSVIEGAKIHAARL
jgi:hypothetical protein